MALRPRAIPDVLLASGSPCWRQGVRQGDPVCSSLSPRSGIHWPILMKGLLVRTWDHRHVCHGPRYCAHQLSALMGLSTSCLSPYDLPLYVRQSQRQKQVTSDMLWTLWLSGVYCAAIILGDRVLRNIPNFFLSCYVYKCPRLEQTGMTASEKLQL